MTDETNIIVVEDDAEIRTLLANYLTREGLAVETAEDGEGLDALLTAGSKPDLVVLDWMLPGEDGLSICRRLRERGGAPAVIMLTAKDEDIDRVLGLEIGADDYVTKPFNPRVLLAHIKAVLRRARPGPAAAVDQCAARLAVADLLVDTDARIVMRQSDNVEVSLTSAEFDLFHCFVTRPQRVLSRDQLLDYTSGRVADVFDRTVDVQVSRLRRKLELSGSSVANLLRTVRNAGYILAAPVRTA